MCATGSLSRGYEATQHALCDCGTSYANDRETTRTCYVVPSMAALPAFTDGDGWIQFQGHVGGMETARRYIIDGYD